MTEPDGFIYKSLVREILPNTKRTQELRAKKKAEEMQKQLELKKAEQRKADMEMQMMRKKQQQQEQLAAENKKKLLEAKRLEEELQQIQTLKGHFGKMVKSLQKNDTNNEYTITGLDLKKAQIRILAKAVESNSTLKGLCMTRKSLEDDEGRQIVDYLKLNKNLERLEMEGNKLGPKTCSSLADLLKTNDILKSVDLEGNILTGVEKTDEKEIEMHHKMGFKNFCQALTQNCGLLTLKLTDCNLDNDCSEFLVKAMRENQTLISLDLDRNPRITKIDNIREIQECLIRNKLAYDDERYEEFIERKQMWQEEQTSQIIATNLEEVLMKKEQQNIKIEQDRREKEDKFFDEEEERIRLMEKTIKQLDKLAHTKKKKKKKGGKKK